MARSDPRRSTTCPGCGLTLPAEPSSPAARLNASPECARLYGEVTGTAMADPTLGRLHQLTVDTYAAQHPRDGGPAIATVFALVGLHLALDRGFSGPEVRDAHQRLAADRRKWPTLGAPAELSALELTIFDVALADSAKDHLHALELWARAVWCAWRREHDTVAQIVTTSKYRGN